MSGKTEMVSKAGKMTTIPEAAFKIASASGDALPVFKPNVKFEKLRLTLDSVFAPKYDAAVVPRKK
jgi:hypothetical protein